MCRFCELVIWPVLETYSNALCPGAMYSRYCQVGKTPRPKCASIGNGAWLVRWWVTLNNGWVNVKPNTFAARTDAKSIPYVLRTHKWTWITVSNNSPRNDCYCYYSSRSSGVLKSIFQSNNNQKPHTPSSNIPIMIVTNTKWSHKKNMWRLGKIQ